MSSSRGCSKCASCSTRQSSSDQEPLSLDEEHMLQHSKNRRLTHKEFKTAKYGEVLTKSALHRSVLICSIKVSHSHSISPSPPCRRHVARAKKRIPCPECHTARAALHFHPAKQQHPATNSKGLAGWTALILYTYMYLQVSKQGTRKRELVGYLT